MGELLNWPCDLPVHYPGVSRLATRGFSVHGIVRVNLCPPPKKKGEGGPVMRNPTALLCCAPNPPLPCRMVMRFLLTAVRVQHRFLLYVVGEGLSTLVIR
jgi:hypothetical protein